MRSSVLLVLLGIASAVNGCGGSSSGGPGGAGGATGKGGSSGGGAGTAGGAGTTGGGSGSGGSGVVCTPGSTQVCVGPGACAGGQSCNSDGRAWGTCDCGGTGAGGNNTGGAGTTGMGGGAAGASGGSGGTAGAIGGSGGAGAMDGGVDAPQDAPVDLPGTDTGVEAPSGDAPTDAPVDGPSCPPGTVACGGACVPTAGADASVTDAGAIGSACDTGKPGVCAAGTSACSGGAVVCNQNVQPSADNTCNGVDENCDGYVDEGSTTCGSCGTPFSIPAGGGAPSFQMNGTGTTSGSCGGGGVERYHVWTPAKSGAATISLWTLNNWYPAVVYVRSGSCSGGEVACATKTGDWPNPMVTLSVTAGTSYYIIADHGSYNGPTVLTYTLTVTPPP